MARSLTGFLPEELFLPSKRREVVAWLQQQPAPANVRRDWLFYWALWVGMRLDHRDYAHAQQGSIEAGPF